MTDHDPLCVSQEFLPADLTRFCDCERVARIRADERERAVTHSTGTDTGGPCCECCYEVGGRNFHLRAQVEALEIRQPWGPAGTAVISRREVLALLGGESDE